MARIMDIGLRCPLFIPGNRADMLSKAGRYPASGYIPDLEDSVPVSRKSEARDVVRDALPYLCSLGVPVIPRVNSFSTGLTEDDLEAVLNFDGDDQIAGVSIGKVDMPHKIEELDDMLYKLEHKVGLKYRSLGILPWIESASGVVNAYTICWASDRVRWVAFGAEDYCADMGIGREVDESSSDDVDTGRVPEYGEASLLYARSAVAVAARAAGVVSLDTPYVRFRDESGLRAESGLARRLGYGGKFAIHPAQIEVIKSVFAPSAAELERARRIVDAADRAADEYGYGAIDVDGEMVDAPVVARAYNLLAQEE